MIISAIDLETTGLDPKVDQVTEVAIVKYDLQNQKVLEVFNVLVSHGDKQITISGQITELTGITNQMINQFGQNHTEVMVKVKTMMENNCDYAMAHNVEFEKSFLNKYAVQKDKWIDTMTDLPFSANITTRKLPHLCADHGIWIRGAHRALTDVFAMIELAEKYPINEIIRYATSPNIQVEAVVSYDNKDKAKERGYIWRSESKSWVKNLKDFQFDEEIQSAPFDIKQIQDPK